MVLVRFGQFISICISNLTNITKLRINHTGSQYRLRILNITH
jgi:hypothetical protein